MSKGKKNTGPIIHHRNTSHLSSMVIGSGHSIMANYIPPVVNTEDFVANYYEWNKPNLQNIESFGLFGGDIDYNTYYPDLDAADLKPKEEEFISPVFRLLSACIVSKNYNPTDFSSDGVLKASMKMLLGQTVNCDHETNIGNAIGSISSVYWQEGYKDGNIIIPAGINGVLLIDGKANPRIARGIMMSPPSIHSNSVTVQFRWDKSHPELSDNEFYEKLGTYDSKGNMVRRMVTEVIRYLETSLVNHGADPYAQKVENGKIVNPKYANRVYTSFSDYVEKETNTVCFGDFKDTQLYNNTGITNNIIINQNKQMDELELFLASLVEGGILTLEEGQEVNKDMVINHIRSLRESNNTLSTQLEEVNNAKAALESQLAEKDNRIASMESLFEIGKNHFAALKEETVNTYNKLMGDKVDESIINLINSESTGISTVKSLLNDYTTRLEEKFPMRCKECGSTNVNRASSIEEEDTTQNHDTEGSSVQDQLRNIYKNKIK